MLLLCLLQHNVLVQNTRLLTAKNSSDLESSTV